MTQRHTGGCHCGRIRFEFDGDIDTAMDCNCSICARRGALLWFMPRGAFKVLTPPESISTYTFHKHVIKHRFCPTCGIHVFGEGIDPNGNPAAAVNLRCVDGLDLAKIPVRHFDGRAL